MKRIVRTLAVLAAISGVLMARPASSCSDLRTSCGAEIASADAEHSHSGAASGKTSAGAGTQQEVACAIDGMKMRATADTPSAEYEGKRYYFCTDSEKQEFLKNPARYIGH